MDAQIEMRQLKQIHFLTYNAVETGSGRHICFYKDLLLVAETPMQLVQLLDCVWR